MKLNLFLYKIEAEIKDDIGKVTKYFRDKGFPIEFNVIETDKGKEYSTQLMLDSDTDVSMYMYDSKYNDMPSFGLCNYISATKVGIWLACDKMNDSVDYTWKSMTHEIMHALNYLLRLKGVYLYDNMDKTLVSGQWMPYYKNEDPYAPDGNYSVCWALMKPHLDKLVSFPQVTITRKPSDNKQTLGHLKAFNGHSYFECETLELPWLNNMRNISCIPKGVYQVTRTFSPRFMRYTYEIQKVPGRSGVRVHPANYYYQLNGCIALGDRLIDINGDGKLDVTNSKKTLTSFEDFMQRKPFTLEIV